MKIHAAYDDHLEYSRRLYSLWAELLLHYGHKTIHIYNRGAHRFSQKCNFLLNFRRKYHFDGMECIRKSEKHAFTQKYSRIQRFFSQFSSKYGVSIAAAYATHIHIFPIYRYIYIYESLTLIASFPVKRFCCCWSRKIINGFPNSSKAICPGNAAILIKWWFNHGLHGWWWIWNGKNFLLSKEFVWEP